MAIYSRNQEGGGGVEGIDKLDVYKQAVQNIWQWYKTQNGDPNLLQKMAEGKRFTRTGPETMAKLLKKRRGLRDQTRWWSQC